MPEDDPDKGLKHAALPVTQIKTNVDTVVSILFCCVSKHCCVDWPLIYHCTIVQSHLWTEYRYEQGIRTKI
jgi:hypothetical protein